MRTYELAHLGDDALLRRLEGLVAQDRTTTANLLAHVAEVDARRLYAPAGYSSMHVYCVEKLRLSDDAAYKRIQVARQARKYPQIYLALAEGRVHLTGLNVLAPHFRADNVDALLAEATHRRKVEIERLVFERFARTTLPLDQGATELAPAQGAILPETVERPQAGTGPAVQPEGPTPARVFADERIPVKFTIDRATQERLAYAQALLGTGDVSRVLRRLSRR